MDETAGMAWEQTSGRMLKCRVGTSRWRVDLASCEEDSKQQDRFAAGGKGEGTAGRMPQHGTEASVGKVDSVLELNCRRCTINK